MADRADSDGRGSERADHYERHVASLEYREERVRKADVILELCRDQLVGAERIADLGSGTGIIKRTLEERCSKSICGFEIDTSFIVERDRTIASDVTCLPVRDGWFDFVILNHLYEHVPDQAGLFAEAFRILRPGGSAYVSAGSRWAVMEPHYRLPFLSWLPGPLADRYLRVSGRGEAYRDIWFRGYRHLCGLMSGPGFEVRDLTEIALRRLMGRGRGGPWRPVWEALRRVPAGGREGLLRAASPQWFFLLMKPDSEAR